MPQIKFMGKSGKVSDYFGEKLTEGFTDSVIKEIRDKYGVKPEFIFVAPCEKEKFCYIVYVEPGKDEEVELYKKAAEAIEESFRKNFHYNYARELGQINRVELFLIESDGVADYLKIKRE